MRFFVKIRFDVHNSHMATDRHQAPSYPLRMPDALKTRVQAAAEMNGRSLHAELLARIEQSFNGDGSEQMQLEISRLQGELEGAKFVANAFMEETAKRIGQMAVAQVSATMSAHRICDLFDELSDLAESYRDGEVKDMALASVRFDGLVSERLAIENEIDQVELPEEMSEAERIAEADELMEAVESKAIRQNRKSKP